MKLLFLSDSLYSLARLLWPYSSLSHLKSTIKAQYCQVVLYLWGQPVPENRWLCGNWFWVKHFCPWLINVRANMRCTETIRCRAVGASPNSSRSLWSPPEKSVKFTKKRAPIYSCKSEWEIFKVNQDEIWRLLQCLVHERHWKFTFMQGFKRESQWSDSWWQKRFCLLPLMEIRPDSSTENAFFESWLLLSSKENYGSYHLQLTRIQKTRESSPETTFGEPQSEESEHSRSGGIRQETVLLTFLLWT